MDFGGNSLPNSINPNHFPAKLWRLVNNPANEAICWDSEGTFVIIDQLLFEKQILSPDTKNLDNADAFKTTNFSSFARQLNLYGFKKADLSIQNDVQSGGEHKRFHHFYNPNFKRNHPELLGSLMRHTVDNKAKMKSGVPVTPTRFQQLGMSGEVGARRGSSSQFSPTHEMSPRPYYLDKSQAMVVYNGTPIPPQYLIRGHGAALSPTVFASDKGIPAALCHPYAGVASRSTPVHFQPGLQVHGSPNFATFNSPHRPYKPGFYSPVCRCFQLNCLTPLTDSGLKTGSFSPHTYYQPRFPVNMCHGDHNPEPLKDKQQEDEKFKVSMDTIFQIADEMMGTPPNNCLVRAVPPEKTGPIIVSNYSTNTSMSVPEKMPEDAIIQVTRDDAEDTEVIDVGDNYSLVVTSQADKSSCTGSTPNL
ncbi:Heat shock factor protein 5 [Collichthys lucidus]|uniref:Heat shock factor protein 5 n=1 Tax=Collichthys lucidus TaxID=240159 RepID=A0A4U5U858_COLLU|nr:Heat shock factor protein 5 [Collichthys lucidus]